MNKRSELEKNNQSFREQWYYNLYICIYIYVYLSYSISQLNPKEQARKIFEETTADFSLIWQKT